VARNIGCYQISIDYKSPYKQLGGLRLSSASTDNVTEYVMKPLKMLGYVFLAPQKNLTQPCILNASLKTQNYLTHLFIVDN